MTLLLIYVDDMLLTSKNMENIKKLKCDLNAKFDIKDLARAKKILGMNIARDRIKGKLKIHQKLYLEKLLIKFAMHNSKPVSLPIAGHFKLDNSLSHNIEEENDFMLIFHILMLWVYRCIQ